jgi:hypothetical protein
MAGRVGLSKHRRASHCWDISERHLVMLHAFLGVVSEGITYLVGSRWRGFVILLGCLVLIWLLLLATR